LKNPDIWKNRNVSTAANDFPADRVAITGRQLVGSRGVNTLWEDLARSAGLVLEPEKNFLLGAYLDVLLEANQHLNLTRITDRAAAEVQHVADALTLLPHLPAGLITLADVGSGGGVPGIPLAIVRPDMRVVLIESTKKKAAFLREAIQKLALQNVQVSDRRAEELARSDQREQFDVVTARAVGALVWLAEWCLPLARKGGKVLAMKGAKIVEELPAAAKAIKLLGGAPPVVHPAVLPGTEHHVIVEIPKITKTDDRYPRNPTTTRGKPLA
jgi:16S rRNA (guanine527-N7)-methyltransferase